MTHIGQKFTLGAAGLLRPQLRFRQLGRAIAYLAIQIRQQRSPLVIQSLPIRQRFLQLLVGFVEPHGHLVEIVHQLLQLGRRLSR